MDYVIAFCLIAIFALWVVFLVLSIALDKTQNVKINSLESEIIRLQQQLKRINKALRNEINESRRKV